MCVCVLPLSLESRLSFPVEQVRKPTIRQGARVSLCLLDSRLENQKTERESREKSDHSHDSGGEGKERASSLITLFPFVESFRPKDRMEGSISGADFRLSAPD